MRVSLGYASSLRLTTKPIAHHLLRGRRGEVPGLQTRTPLPAVPFAPSVSLSPFSPRRLTPSLEEGQRPAGPEGRAKRVTLAPRAGRAAPQKPLPLPPSPDSSQNAKRLASSLSGLAWRYDATCRRSELVQFLRLDRAAIPGSLVP